MAECTAGRRCKFLHQELPTPVASPASTPRSKSKSKSPGSSKSPRTNSDDKKGNKEKAASKGKPRTPRKAKTAAPAIALPYLAMGMMTTLLMGPQPTDGLILTAMKPSNEQSAGGNLLMADPPPWSSGNSAIFSAMVSVSFNSKAKWMSIKHNSRPSRPSSRKGGFSKPLAPDSPGVISECNRFAQNAARTLWEELHPTVNISDEDFFCRGAEISSRHRRRFALAE